MSLIASIAYPGNISGGGGTSGAIDTTGAKSIIIAAGNRGVNAFTVSDNKGNTYIALTDYNNGWGSAQIFYCLTPTVGTGHTFTLSGTNSQVAGIIYAFSETLTFHSVNGASVSFSTSLSTGSVTPSANGALIVTCSGGSTVVTTDTVTPGFGTVTNIPIASGNTNTSAAWQIQATAAPIAATWTYSPQQSEVAATIAAFLVVAAAATTVRVSQDVIELISLPTPQARVSQDIIELISFPHPEARVSQHVIEIISANVAAIVFTEQVQFTIID